MIKCQSCNVYFPKVLKGTKPQLLVLFNAQYSQQYSIIILLYVEILVYCPALPLGLVVLNAGGISLSDNSYGICLSDTAELHTVSSFGKCLYELLSCQYSCCYDPFPNSYRVAKIKKSCLYLLELYIIRKNS